ncbi:hypothetical protein [Nocardioides sp. cx-173]|uniref:hypothetical protein n=1 Tax=Nocardioides sp. cx-173 TaxID=2898796 RepID=UPI001E400DBC|nr:hypothetical protein [Nocardioides sp. cx-173]MCD4524565.1 hypothetical protein [Nocardioides sp. cx-173]UGB42950.1 hypothetical protein LQ940_05360 [Nocardioides sp. cx-173]
MSKAAEIQQALRDGCSHPSHDEAINSIPGLFEPWDDMPEPSEFDPAMDSLRLAMANLSSGEVDSDPISNQPVSVNMNLLEIDSVAGELTEWEGEAMESFRDHVQTPFPGVTKNLYNAAAVLYGAAEAEKAMWEAANNDLNSIADKAISAADKMCETGSGQASFWITVTASVVGVALAVPTGGASVAAVAGVFAVAGSGIATDWSVDTPEEAVEKIASALETLQEKLLETETKIQAALNGVNAALTEGGNGYQLLSPVSLFNGPGGIDGRG